MVGVKFSHLSQSYVQQAKDSPQPRRFPPPEHIFFFISSQTSSSLNSVAVVFRYPVFSAASLLLAKKRGPPRQTMDNRRRPPQTASRQDGSPRRRSPEKHAGLRASAASASLQGPHGPASGPTALRPLVFPGSCVAHRRPASRPDQPTKNPHPPPQIDSFFFFLTSILTHQNYYFAISSSLHIFITHYIFR